jgi:hypothetical protein
MNANLGVICPELTICVNQTKGSRGPEFQTTILNNKGQRTLSSLPHGFVPSPE